MMRVHACMGRPVRGGACSQAALRARLLERTLRAALRPRPPARPPARPQTFLELIKLYKSALAQKRKGTQEAIDRLENGLNKLHKTQADVDVLVEDARKMAVEVEHKVASANVFADQVGVEKEKVAAENDSAKVEADKCAAIAKEVSEKQVRAGVARGRGQAAPAQAAASMPWLAGAAARRLCTLTPPSAPALLHPVARRRRARPTWPRPSRCWRRPRRRSTPSTRRTWARPRASRSPRPVRRAALRGWLAAAPSRRVLRRGSCGARRFQFALPSPTPKLQTHPLPPPPPPTQTQAWTTSPLWSSSCWRATPRTSPGARPPS
jgi:hypothetical protein